MPKPSLVKPEDFASFIYDTALSFGVEDMSPFAAKEIAQRLLHSLNENSLLGLLTKQLEDAKSQYDALAAKYDDLLKSNGSLAKKVAELEKQPISPGIHHPDFDLDTYIDTKPIIGDPPWSKGSMWPKLPPMSGPQVFFGPTPPEGDDYVWMSDSGQIQIKQGGHIKIQTSLSDAAKPKPPEPPKPASIKKKSSLFAKGGLVPKPHLKGSQPTSVFMDEVSFYEPSLMAQLAPSISTLLKNSNGTASMEVYVDGATMPDVPGVTMVKSKFNIKDPFGDIHVPGIVPTITKAIHDDLVEQLKKKKLAQLTQPQVAAWYEPDKYTYVIQASLYAAPLDN